MSIKTRIQNSIVEDIAGSRATPKTEQSPLEWQCVGHNPTRWALGIMREIKQDEQERYQRKIEGYNQDFEMVNVRAEVFRLSSGRWGFRLIPDRLTFTESEPSRDTAMSTAERYIKRPDVQLRRSIILALETRMARVLA